MEVVELKKEQDPTETIEPTVEEVVVTLGKEENDTRAEFVQRPLSFFGKMDFFAVMGRALDRAMSGPDGISVADLLEAPGTTQELREADTFIRGLAKIVSHAPETLGDLYCVILAVPRGHREYAKELMGLPEEQGGLSDDQGIGILETFVDQNWDVLSDFFGQRIKGLADKLGSRMGEKSQ